MKKTLFFFSIIALLMSGCYKDDINDLKDDINKLKKEQERQAELLAAYQTLLQALESKATITSINEIADGYKIVFSNGNEMTVRNGKDGSDVSNALAIVKVVDVGGSVIFYMSDGSTITIGKAVNAGLWALSEGVWGGGNGQLRFIEYNESTDKYALFTPANEDAKQFTNWGETPNDLMIYGSKMYSAITGTTDGVVRVVNPSTGETIQDIVITIGTDKQQPRRLAASNGNVYVTLYSGAVAKIDTASFAAQVTELSGTFSDGLCVYGGYLYICNSGQGEGNTISVVNIAQFVETETITVPYNPMNIVSVGNGELYFNTAAVWSGPAFGAPANVHVLNTATKTVTKTFDIEVESIATGKNYVYGAATDWSDFSGILKKISIADKSVSDFTTSTSSLLLAYRLSVNPLNGEVFLTQQMGGGLTRFAEDGTFIQQISNIGQQNGAAVVFVNTVKYEN